jgi:hypothetical protein
MANNTQNDFIIYDEEMNTALNEKLLVNIDLWNSATRGALVLTTQMLKGHYSKMSMYKALAETVVEEYDPRNVTQTVFNTIETFENVTVKVWRDTNFQKTVDAFKVLLLDPEYTFSEKVGMMTADLITKDAIETLLGAIIGATEGEASNVIGDGSAFMTFKDINKGQFVWGDQYSKVACMIMHSNTTRGIVDLNIDEKLDSIAGFTISSGSWNSLGIPIITADLQ